ncbi:CDP-glycerol glycerophosphotransferase family protein [Salinicoccus jeotgali]|uniref:CDP-glycerol glycerophosphotransferase family protein n=2 Tax=Salinicoccus jeotgali TaxID=381634 RepID=A0ABP7F4E3_9STAP
MIKEAALAIYLTAVRTVFRLCRLAPLQHKTVMLASFGDNIQVVASEVSAQTDSRVVILKEPGCRQKFDSIASRNIIRFSPARPSNWLKGLYHLATAEVVFVDNYHLILAACDFRQEAVCVQLWHANGAVKMFGLYDKTASDRPKSAIRRFRQVYSRFHKVVVSSDEMAGIFKRAFGLDEANILKTGVPRTDFYRSTQRVKKAREEMEMSLPQLRDKKVLLYAPTFRDSDFTIDSLPLDLEKMKDALGTDHHLLIQLHRTVQLVDTYNSDFVTHTSGKYDIASLLSVADLLITDYSSIPFEFSMLGRPMLFFAYDLEQYKVTRGIWFEYTAMMPGPVARTTDDVIRHIKENHFDYLEVASFDAIWNKYATGNASKNLVEVLYKKTPEEI